MLPMTAHILMGGTGTRITEADMAEFIEFSGMEAEITRLIDDLNRAKNNVNEATEGAAMASADIIRKEQQRLFAKVHFKRDKEGHRYNNIGSGLISIKQDERAKGKVYKLRIGYDTETLRRYPELLVIEFGRPGKSRNRKSLTSTVKRKGKNGKTIKFTRKKGDFPAHVSHIRAGFFLAKDKAVNAFNEKLLEVAERNFRG